MNNHPRSAFSPYIPPSVSSSPSSLGSFTTYYTAQSTTPTSLSSYSLGQSPSARSPSPSPSASSTPTAYKGFEPLALKGCESPEAKLHQLPSISYSFPSPTGLFVFGLLKPEEVYHLRYDIISRLASKIFILLADYKNKSQATYKSFHKDYLSICETLTAYPIFLFQKLNFSVGYFEGVNHKEQDRYRILRHLEILKLDFGADPFKYFKVGRIKIKSGHILWCTNSNFNTVHFDHKDLPDLEL